MVNDRLFGGIYNGKRVLLTGHSGFKGSWMYIVLQRLGATVKGYSLLPNTSPAHAVIMNIENCNENNDILDATNLNEVFADFKPDIVFHFAAQPLVRKSYNNPKETFNTNIIGTTNLFEAIRNSHSIQAMVNITTDKVYHNNEWAWPYREIDTLGGYDPYSASKACVEIVHSSYRNSFFKNKGIYSATVRAGNVIGGGDWSEDRLIPDTFKAANEGKSVPIRNPTSVRPWQHVLDPISAYLLLGKELLQKNELADTSWNIGPSQEDCLSVKDVLTKVQGLWDAVSWQDISSEAKVHEANLLKLDCSKATSLLKWKPIWTIDTAIKHTTEWYKMYYMNKKVLTISQIESFFQDAEKMNSIICE